MEKIALSLDELATVYAGDYEVPMTVLADEEEPPFTLDVAGRSFDYVRSVPVKGHGASLPPLLDAWVAEGRDVVAGQRGGRYYLYATPAAAPAKAAKPAEAAAEA